jgi:HAD superfamily hydrolase (TIGR01509 family)
MYGFDAIFFDFDGVLIDSEPVHWACWREVLLPLGVSLEWEFYRNQCIGIDDRLMLQMMATASDPPRDWQEMWAQYPAKKELFRARMIDAPPFPQGIAALLEELQERYKLAVVSSSSCAEIEPLLAKAGLRDYFQTIVGGESVKHHKPAPDPYLLAAERLEARTALVLEDSDAGLASGRAAGFEALRVCHPNETADVVRRRLNGN